MSKQSFSVIILAAGQGTRMKSPLPKVVHPVAGAPMLRRVIDAVNAAGASEVRVVVGYGEALVRQVAEPLGAVCMKQKQQWGTGDAVKAAQPESLEGPVLILNGDHPLITSEDIQTIIQNFAASKSVLSVVTCKVKEPGSFGRIVRHKDELQAIVEAKDASTETLKIKEINTGIYVIEADALNEYLPEIKNQNAQNEYYLTDIVAVCRDNQEALGTISVPKRVAFGVNSQMELAKATRVIFRRKVRQLMEKGVVFVDPTSVYVEDDVEIGEATVVYPGCYFRGKTQIGPYGVIEPNCYFTNCEIADSVQIKAGSYLEETVIKSRATIGPYARLRPGTQIGVDAKVGNFVEMKKTVFGDGAKASHLTYLGDAEIGPGTNIGCGTITCNYAADKRKYKTIIGKDVFVGSDSQFVAPITVGDQAIIGSGSTITKDVPSGALAVARGRQVIKENYSPKATVEPNERITAAPQNPKDN